MKLLFRQPELFLDLFALGRIPLRQVIKFRIEGQGGSWKIALRKGVGDDEEGVAFGIAFEKRFEPRLVEAVADRPADLAEEGVSPD